MSATDFAYAVTGSWPFPVDMLRRDGSEAASPADQALIDHLSSDYAHDLSSITEPVTINLVIKNAGRHRPYTARWESFGWKVPGDLDHAALAEERAFRQRADALYAQAKAKLTDEELRAVADHFIRH